MYSRLIESEFDSLFVPNSFGLVFRVVFRFYPAPYKYKGPRLIENPIKQNINQCTILLSRPDIFQPQCCCSSLDPTTKGSVLGLLDDLGKPTDVLASMGPSQKRVSVVLLLGC